MTTYRLVFLLLMLCVSSNATAAWITVEVGEHEKAYLDPASLQRHADNAMLTALVDLVSETKLSDGKPFVSWTTQYEFGCRTKKFRVLAATLYQGSMGEGEVANHIDFDAPKWEPLVAGTRGADLWKFACRKSE